MENYNVIGLMSGSSLDGLDIAYCTITEDNGKWSYKINTAECIEFPPKWRLRLEKLVLQNAVTYIKTHTFFGHFMGDAVKDFIDRHGIENDLQFIASHGQTIFHQPENRFTSQIGDGASIAIKTGFPTICDFRTSDVALGGQGTPVAPTANKLLFPDTKYFLNLGGISNIACKVGDRYIAFDVSPVNLILNKLSSFAGKPYDKDGAMARSGVVNDALLEELNGSWYYEKDYPKSLSGGWVNKVMLPVLNRHNIAIEDKLRTTCELIAHQLSNAFIKVQEKEGVSISEDDELLVTGGGGFNKFLIERIQASLPMKVVVPDADTVEFIEAVLIALLGVLRVRSEANCMSSVTGAEYDTVGGAIYQGGKRFLKTSI